MGKGLGRLQLFWQGPGCGAPSSSCWRGVSVDKMGEEGGETDSGKADLEAGRHGGAGGDGRVAACVGEDGGGGCLGEGVG